MKQISNAGALVLLTGVALVACGLNRGGGAQTVPRPAAPPAGQQESARPQASACPEFKTDDVPVDMAWLHGLAGLSGRPDCAAGFMGPRLATGAAGRVWVVLGKPAKGLGDGASIRVERMHAGIVVLSKPLGMGPLQGLKVRVRAASGVLCEGPVGGPVILARLTTQSETKIPTDGRALSAEQKKQLAGFWAHAGKVVAIPVSGCKVPAQPRTSPVWAELVQAGRTGPRSSIAKDQAVDPGLRTEAVTRLRAMLGLEAKYRNAAPLEVHAKAMAMPKGGVLLAVSAVWGDWPVCGQKGQAGAALWYLFRGKWHLLRQWKDRGEPVKLMVAGGLDGDGATMECILEEDGFTRHRVMYRIQNRDSSTDGEDDGKLVPFRSDESPNEGCPC